MPFALPSILSRLAGPMRQHPHRTALTAILIAACAALFFETLSGNLSNLAKTFQADLRPNGYTELAFAAPTQLPTQLTKDGAVSFAFAVHNVQGSTVTYPFTVYSEISGSQEIPLATGNLTLQNGQWTTTHETVHVSRPGFTQQIFVSLPLQQQTIDFWIKGAKQ